MSPRAYRSLVSLYPRRFRAAYGEDLVQHFTDLVAERGARAAWARTSVDLIVTLPRYRLESIMTEPHTTTAITAAIAICALTGALGVLTDIYPGGPLLLLVAAGLAVSQRTSLAKAIRTPRGANPRRNRLATAAILALVSIGTVISYLVAVSHEDVSGASLVVHNAIGVPAMIGTLVYLIIGLLTPSGQRRELSPTA